MRNINIKHFICTMVILFFLPCAVASEPAPAQFSKVRGDVDLLKKSDQKLFSAEVGMAVFLGDLVRTKQRSRAQLTFSDQSKINVSSNSSLELKTFSFDAKHHIQKSVIRTMRGTIRAVIHKASGDVATRFEVETPTAVAAVRGTEFYVVVRSSELTEVVVVSGSVQVSNIDPKIRGSVLIGPEQMSRIQRGLKPTAPQQVMLENLRLLDYQTTPKPESSNTADNIVAAPLALPLLSPSTISNTSIVIDTTNPETEHKAALTPRDTQHSLDTGATLPPVTIPITDPANVGAVDVPVDIAPRLNPAVQGAAGTVP